MKLNKRYLIFLAALFIFGVPVVVALQNQSSRNQAIGSIPPLQNEAVDTEAPRGFATMTVGSVAKKYDPQEPSDQNVNILEPNRAVVRKATLDIVVDDPRSKAQQIIVVTQKYAGLVISSNVYENAKSNKGATASLTVRVPAEKLDTFLTEVRGLATSVTRESLSSDDRTKQKVDWEAQLKNFRATETQMLTIMAQAKTVEETLRVQTELTKVREKIEILQAQLQNLGNDVAMSNVTVSLVTKDSDVPTFNPTEKTFIEEIEFTIKQTLRLYRNLLVLVIRATIFFSPILILFILSWLMWQRNSRRS